MTTILMLRHAAHDNVGAYLAGRTPGVSLGVNGKAQARRLGERLRVEAIESIFSSPRERARETAAAVGEACHLPAATVLNELDEIDFGEWSGKDWETLNQDPRWRRWNEARSLSPTAGGERMVDVAARALRALQIIQDAVPGGVAALVTHADVIRATVMQMLGMSLDDWWRLEIAPASVTRLAFEDGRARIITLNETG